MGFRFFLKKFFKFNGLKIHANTDEDGFVKKMTYTPYRQTKTRE
ncbi:hypothetical protein [uncultured Gammaproteobacteria bacterium]|nr:hypothetical protein [uncultured Gammaproteobacteria bacterium]CAC9639103.1 hypothetical protein [uncultured Gammaproteobacteria bacterium]